MEDVLGMVVVLPLLFIGLPWLIFHYITKWKTAATLTSGDEKLLDELHEAARRLDDRAKPIVQPASRVMQVIEKLLVARG